MGTPEERAAKVAKERAAEAKGQAYLLVKRDDVATLRTLIASLDEDGVVWKNWKDFSGRSLLQCAYNLRSTKAQRFLEPLMLLTRTATAPRSERTNVSISSSSQAVQPKVPDEKAPTLLGSISADSRLSSSSSRSTLASKQSGRDAEKSPEKPAIATAPAPAALTLPLAAEIERRKNLPQAPAQADMSMRRKIPNEAELMRDAFRAVLDSKVPKEVWGEWKNKAGKDLLSLSEERGSTAAYSYMAKALGLIKDRKRDSYEEREAVW